VRRRLAAIAVAVVTLAALAVLAPDAALAHGISGREDLPIPRWLFSWAAAVVLVVSFVALATLWPRPRLEHAPERRVLRVPAALEVVCGALGVAAFAFVVYAGFAGTQSATANLAPTVVFVVFWVGIPFVTLLLGDVFAAFSPWRATARAAGWLAARVGARPPAPLAYPERLGHWPAAVGILAFAWVELGYVNRDDPSTLAVLALLYAAAQLVGISLYGVDAWTQRADAFGAAFGLYARLAPLHWRERVLFVRAPLSGAPRLLAGAGTAALLAALLGTTSFDGFSNTELWSGGNGLAVWLQQRFVDLGLSAEAALELAVAVGLVAMVAFVWAIFRLGIEGMRSVAGGLDPEQLVHRFVHTLIPIAFAYLAAHYFSLLAYNGQAMAYLVSDPLGNGSDFFGTASRSIDYSVIGSNGIWYVQVAALVAGHACGLTLAHDRALVVFPRARQAARSQYWMLAVMVGFTCLGLWLLSAAA
jgi:hypothetical protein